MDRRKGFAKRRLAAIGAAIGILVILFWPDPFSGKLYEERVAEKTASQIIRAISAHDPAKIKELFSPAALAQAQELDASIAELLAWFQGETLSAKVQGCVLSEHIEFLKNAKQVRASIIVVTDRGEYKIYFARWTQKQGDPDMVGIYSIQFAEFADTQSEGFRFFPSEEAPGIHILRPGIRERWKRTPNTKHLPGAGAPARDNG